MTNKQRYEQAHIQLSFMQDQRIRIQGSEFWLEPAIDYASPKVIERRGGVSGRKVLREKRPGEKKILNHWRCLV